MPRDRKQEGADAAAGADADDMRAFVVGGQRPKRHGRGISIVH